MHDFKPGERVEGTPGYAEGERGTVVSPPPDRHPRFVWVQWDHVTRGTLDWPEPHNVRKISLLEVLAEASQ